MTFLIVIGFGFISRNKAQADLQQATAAAAIATVNVVYPKPDAPTDEIVLPGNTQRSPTRRSTRAPAAMSKAGTWKHRRAG